MKLILLRHGESEWNLLNKFTGWTDIGLTDNGINEAQFSGKQILKENISIKDLRKKIIHYVDEKFKGNENYKKIIETSAFCSEDNNIISDSYQITKDQKIGIIPPIGGG